jgi:hypothetical protein
MRWLSTTVWSSNHLLSRQPQKSRQNVYPTCSFDSISNIIKTTIGAYTQCCTGGTFFPTVMTELLG